MDGIYALAFHVRPLFLKGSFHVVSSPLLACCLRQKDDILAAAVDTSQAHGEMPMTRSSDQWGSGLASWDEPCDADLVSAVSGDECLDSVWRNVFLRCLIR